MPGSYEHDVFISYAHIDNEPLIPGEDGWVTSLHEALRRRLDQLVGRRVQIWRDSRLARNAFLDDSLKEVIEKSAVMVSVISPSYRASAYCNLEVEEFCRVAGERLRAQNRSKVCKVVKTPIPLEDHPKQLQNVLSYDFFEHDEAGKLREFSQKDGSNPNPNYWRQLQMLASDIKDLLDAMEKPAPDTSVYLAVTTSDLEKQRDEIRRELQQRGFNVLPDRPLPSRADELASAITEWLKEAKLSIHLIGQAYGIIPEGEEDRSIVRIQNDLAAERSGEADFSRLIWIPPGLAPTGQRQLRFIEDLKTDSNAQRGAELLETTIEELKSFILNKLTKPKPAPAPEAAPAPSENGLTRVYLICDQRDIDYIGPVVDHIVSKEYEPVLPLLEGSEEEVREEHKNSLRECDAALIYYGNGPELWLRSKLSDLLKSPGYGRTKPWLAKAVYVGAPVTTHKRIFNTAEARVIKSLDKGPDQFDANLLSAFFNQLEIVRGGRKCG
jgi:hypothetical protein